jgi:Xaa-Pro dipeptidase
MPIRGPWAIGGRTPTRRTVLGVAAAGFSAVCGGAPAAPDTAGLRSLTTGAAPISASERRGRVAKLAALMRARSVGGLVVEAGSSLEYFTGLRWGRSERTTAAAIRADGSVVLVTPSFEEPRVRETLQVTGDVRTWEEDESPFVALAGALRADLARGRAIAFEGTTRSFIVDGVRRALGGGRVVPGDPMVHACRMIKSPAELALMQAANDVTLGALREVHRSLRPGMSRADVVALMNGASSALGAHEIEFTLVLLNEASAYPHGTRMPQAVREGSVVLMDCGCNVHGYQSDITRTWVVGDPTPRQRRVWATVRRGQDVALETARPGAPCGRIDDVVRAYYAREGWGPGYRLPGMPHRTGHGIGLDGHEPPFLVRGDATPLRPGMCFSDEPGLYLPGEFGVRLEDCWRMTESGPVPFTPLARSLDDPI